jgi:tetratricopeptide (TPR) repeat protein
MKLFMGHRTRLKTVGTWLVGIAALATAAWAFRLWMAETIVAEDPTIEGYTRALAWNPGSDEYHAILGGGYRDLVEGYDLDAAVRELERAVALRPGAWTHHATLAATLEMKGEFEEAEDSFRKALELNPRNVTLLWLEGNYFLRRGNLDRATAAFRSAVELEPGRLDFAADRLHAMGVSVEEIGEKLVPGNRIELLAYLNFSLGQLEDDPGRADALVWRTWTRWVEAPAQGYFSVNGIFPYIGRLVQQGRFDRAREVWRTGLHEAGLAEPGPAVVYNGGFETEALGGGFDWVMPKQEEVYCEYDRKTRFQGGASLRIDFAGESNPAFLGPRQTLILPVGTFRLSFVARSEGITSDQGIYLSLRSLDDLRPLARSEPLRGTREWAKIQCPFQTQRPVAAELAVMRDASEKFGSDLAGKVWIDDVKIEAFVE